jgi:hypothetical protein
MINQGYLSGNNANLTYPAIGVTSSGKGVMAFTLVGPNNFPSAAYALIDATNGTGPIHIAAAGLGLVGVTTGLLYLMAILSGSLESI